MSFFRPEAIAAVRRYAEPVIYGAVAIWGIWRGWLLLDRGAWVGAVLIAIGIFAALGLFGAVQRAIYAWRGRREGPGIVSVQEGRISYFGPTGGAIIAMDALTSVDIITTGAGPVDDDLFWVLSDEIGQRVAIPGSAGGADKLLDRLGSLSGFDHIAVVRAMGTTEDNRFQIWRRSPHSALDSS